MSGTPFEKLVRDKTPEILTKKGVPHEVRVADSVEYKTELIKKLSEETAEFCIDGEIEEFADVLEVVEALRKLPEYKEVEKMQNNKREEKGAFEKRFIVKGNKE